MKISSKFMQFDNVPLIALFVVIMYIKTYINR